MLSVADAGTATPKLSATAAAAAAVSVLVFTLTPLVGLAFLSPVVPRERPVKHTAVTRNCRATTYRGAVAAVRRPMPRATDVKQRHLDRQPVLAAANPISETHFVAACLQRMQNL